jgi:hypothetical protein
MGNMSAATDLDTLYSHETVMAMLWVGLCVVPAEPVLYREATPTVCVIYIFRSSKRPLLSVQQRRLIARSLDEVRTKGDESIR